MNLPQVMFLLVLFVTGTPSVQAAPPDHFVEACGDENDAQGFADRACYLDETLLSDPGQVVEHNESYSSPKCSAKTVPNKDLIRDAYAAAPAYLKKKLCRLTHHDCDQKGGCKQLFISTLSQSWGFWEGSDRCGHSGCTTPSGRKQPIGMGVFMAISEKLLTAPPTFHAHETLITRQLLRASSSDTQLPRFTSSTPSDTKYALLSVFAHEMGHLLLANMNTDGVFKDHPRTVLYGDPANACFKDKILDVSWSAAKFKAHGRRWITFRFFNDDEHKKAGFDWKSVRKDVKQGKDLAATKAVKGLYDKKEFVSLFAALRPEEDFIETYKYKVMKDTLTSLMIEFPNVVTGGTEVLDYVNQGDPSTKLQCLSDLGLLQ